VEYREQKQGGRYLQGDTLTYDKEGGWVVIEGSPERPCKADGVNVQMIQYHPQTGQLKTKLSPSPSSLPLQGG
jgi:lipopolysaccharide export system protein LptA